MNGDLTTTIISGIEQILQKLVELGPTIFYVLISLFVAFIAIKIVQHFVRKFFDRVDFNEDIEHLLTRAVGWALWFFVLMWLVGQLGLENMFASLLAVGALGGLAVALAVKDSLKDVVAGILILKDRHFDLHDVVKIGSAKGEIIDVSLRKTRILQEDGSIQLIQNFNPWIIFWNTLTWMRYFLGLFITAIFAFELVQLQVPLLRFIANILIWQDPRDQLVSSTNLLCMYVYFYYPLSVVFFAYTYSLIGPPIWAGITQVWNFVAAPFRLWGTWRGRLRD